MNISKIASSTVIIETEDTKILCDPWIENGEYYGSWSIVQELFDKEKLYKKMNDCENIYFSHIHPDHFSKKTLKKIDKDKKVFLHKYASPFLKKNLEILGFTNINEIENGESLKVKGNTNITIFAADNCDPNICNKFVGCNYSEESKNSQQIDSCAVISDKSSVCLNLNDCMQPMMKETIKNIKNKFKRVNILLVNYNSAHSYPQNIKNIKDPEKIRIGNNIKQINLEKSIKYIEDLCPDFFIPFAGEYTLSGKKFLLNDFKGTNSQNECYDFFMNTKYKNNLVMLNYGNSFDGSKIPVFKKIHQSDLLNYNQKLSELTYDYDLIEKPSKDEIEDLSNLALINVMKKINFFKLKFNHVLYIQYYEKFIYLDFDNNYIKFVNEIISDNRSYTILHLDEKLLIQLLKGPRFAHWNNADIGSHIDFTKSRIQDYDYKLFNCIAYFHS